MKISGYPLPFGASRKGPDVNFSVVTSTDQPVYVDIYDSDRVLLATHSLSSHTGDVRHTLALNVPLGSLYALRVGESPLLIDPYAKAVDANHSWGEPFTPLCSIDIPPFDWEDDSPLHLPMEELIIYEMHVRGFTQDTSSHVQEPGTYQGVIEKIPYLQELGITAVELLPIHEFNETEIDRKNPLTKERLYNYWGYSTVNFFSPMARYGRGDPVNEFRNMVKSLHAAGIEVILDVVYNHTAEGNKQGPTLHFKALDNKRAYLLDAQGDYLNISGTGNTVKANEPYMTQLILNSLRYWVTEMHVDGFRFDLASVFYRDDNGEPIPTALIIEAISRDPILAQTKLIAEPWDAAMLYQVGAFYPFADRWSEWNGRYRDTVRKFIKGTDGTKNDFATRLCGSTDLYGTFRSATASINFITCHDGFSLQDLVSYNHKHNEVNNEDNRDGMNDNESWNCGAEGTTAEPDIDALRERQKRNFILALTLSLGVPMFYMGDEYGHTKQGNNNTWCQDNRLSWFCWDELSRNAPFHRFVKAMIRFRKKEPLFQRKIFLTPEEIDWHGHHLHQPDWNTDQRLLAYTLKDPDGMRDLFIAFNAVNQNATIEIPEGQWQIIAQTAVAAPDDFVEEQNRMFQGSQFEMTPYSALLLRKS